jgi:ABC-type Fe3+ transport system permease subunit
MTEKELGKALLELDMAPPAAPDARQLTRQILARDRRRVRLLAAITTFFWVLSAGSVGWLIAFYFLHIAPRLRAYGAGRAKLQNDWDAWARVGDWAANSVLGCLIALVLAAVCTVMLILLTRRATLRQINAGLAEIAERLKALGQVPAGERRESGG